MEDSEIENLKIPQILEDDAIVFIWTTSPMMEKAIAIGKKWGLTFVNIFIVWKKLSKNGNKNKPCLGLYSRQQVEFLLMFKKGNVSQFKKNYKYFSNSLEENEIYFSDESSIHSMKPPKVLKIIDNMFFNLKKLEIFSRKSTNMDWDFVGNEKNKFGSVNVSEEFLKRRRIKQEENYSIIKSFKFEDGKYITLNKFGKIIIKQHSKKINKKKRKRNSFSNCLEYEQPTFTQALIEIKKKKLNKNY